MNTVLDFAHPLWKVTLVDNHPEGSVIIVRVHHCIADGISLMQVLLRMTKTAIEEPANQAAMANPNRDDHPVDGEPAIPGKVPQTFARGEVSPIISQTKPGKTASNPGQGTTFRKPNAIEITAAMLRVVFSITRSTYQS